MPDQEILGDGCFRRATACRTTLNQNVKREPSLTWPMVSSNPLISASGKEEGKPLIVIIAAMACAAVNCFSQHLLLKRAFKVGLLTCAGACGQGSFLRCRGYAP